MQANDNVYLHFFIPTVIFISCPPTPFYWLVGGGNET